MENISKLLNAKRLDVRGILSSPVTVSIKEDGTAFQVYNVKQDDGTICTTYHKRSDRPNAIGQEISEIEKMINGSYYHAIKFAEQYKDILNEYSIINFELMNDEHLIDNIGIDRIVLLSAFNYNEKNIEHASLEILAEKLSISCKKALFLGQFSNEIVDFLMENGSNFGVSTTHLEFLKNLGNIEGFVFSFNCGDKIRNYKLINPKFKNLLDEHLENEKEDRKRYDCTYSYKLILNKTDKNVLDITLWDGLDNPCHRICYWWESLLYTLSKKELDNILTEIGNIPLIRKTKLNSEYVTEYGDLYQMIIYDNDTKYIPILIFMLYGFMNERHQYPLWTSYNVQERLINPFVRHIYNTN